MDWKNLSIVTVLALAFLVFMLATLFIPNGPNDVVLAFGLASVSLSILALRDK